MKAQSWKIGIVVLYGIAAIAAVAAVAPPSANKAEARLAELAAAVLSADYRGDRAELARLDAELGRLEAGSLSDYRDYWRGFALWRRAMNGFNETPAPADLDADLVAALERFRSALARHPDWDEVKSAMLGCWGNRIYLAGTDTEKRKKLFEESGDFYKWVMAYEGDNPRVLWIKGGLQMVVPPSAGGDWTKAAATLRKGVTAAWREASAATPPLPWAPAWGGAENLMNLAYLHSHLPTPERDVALAYAEGALTKAPQWHFVKDIQLPMIEALPVKADAASAAP